MSVRQLQQRDCGDQEQLQDLSTRLTDIIAEEMFWDFRVHDAYIQRTLMLAEAGRFNLINPNWIIRIIDAQNDDGGWDGIHPLITLPNNMHIGINTTSIVYSHAKSDFHATAQAILLLSILKKHHETNNN